MGLSSETQDTMVILSLTLLLIVFFIITISRYPAPLSSGCQVMRGSGIPPTATFDGIVAPHSSNFDLLEHVHSQIRVDQKNNPGINVPGFLSLCTCVCVCVCVCVHLFGSLMMLLVVLLSYILLHMLC